MKFYWQRKRAVCQPVGYAHQGQGGVDEFLAGLMPISGTVKCCCQNIGTFSLANFVFVMN